MYKKAWLLITVLTLGGIPVARAAPEWAIEQHPAHQTALNEFWSWSGVIHTDRGAKYVFYFTVNKQADKFTAVSKIYNLNARRLEFEDFSEQVIPESQSSKSPDFNWKIGNALLNYNSVNNSWVFGAMNKEKNGFNFRVDGIRSSNSDDSVKNHRGLFFYTQSFKRLNGSLSIKHDDLFVNADSALLEHNWMNQSSPGYELQTVVCNLDKRGNLYAVWIKDDKKTHYSYINWLDEQGKVKPVSQFIKSETHFDRNTHSKVWKLSSRLPKFIFSFEVTKEFGWKTKEFETLSLSGLLKETLGVCSILKINS